MPPKRAVARPLEPLDILTFLDAAGVPYRTLPVARGAVVYNQGAQATSVFYIEDGSIKLSVLSPGGKAAVVGMLGEGEFFGEGCLADQPLRIGTATAVTATRLLRIRKPAMLRALHEHSDFAERFLSYMLLRNIRIEADLVDQLFNSSEKRLARTLLLLARYGRHGGSQRVLPKLSHETLAEIVGTTRSRINVFMNKFRRLGFIEYNGELKIHSSLLSIVSHD